MTSERVIRGETYGRIGQEVSWVGPCPWTGTLGLGFESGRFLAEPVDAREGDEIEYLDVLPDVVNGGAFAGDFAAFSCREAVAVVRRRGPGSLAADRLPHAYHGGAHGVMAASWGGFVVPVGLNGVLLLKPSPSGSDVISRVAQRKSDPWYAYQLTLAGRHDDGGDVVAYAAGNHGVVAFSCGGVERDKVGRAVAHGFPGRDVIDVCPLNCPQLPRGVAALTRDRKILLIPDVMTDAKADIGVLDYPGFTGTGYNILAAQGHLFVLTGRDLLTLPRVVDLFAADRLSAAPHVVGQMPVESSGLYPVGPDRVALIIGPKAVEYAVDDLVEEAAQAEPVRPMASVPEWSTRVDDMHLAVA